jgi:type II secretory pathway component GspD/PulD (secretin)
MRIPTSIFSLLFYATLTSGYPISSSESPIAVWNELPLNRIKPDEAERIIAHLIPDAIVEMTPNGLSLYANPYEHAYAVKIIRKIDQPATASPTSFVRLHNTKAEEVARLLRFVAKTTIRNDDFQVVSDPKTNRIFMTGEVKLLAIAESIVTHLDRWSRHSARECQ